MAMSTGGDSGGPMSEINVTPLVDVMLVLLIIFMITAPLMSHRITVELPTANPKVPDTEQVTPMDLAVKPDGTLYLDDVEVTEAELKAQFAVKATLTPQPELQIRADKTTQYKIVKKVLADAKESGMVHVGFMTTGKE
ncbi:ExbD/TolR family protein [Dyella japonica]|jgi:biopolymer transport protein ExbD|uniref:Biopolymer transporter ExbD n=1 Tax=Dyella japonica DSM 16301 TaxID=1440762 RepID=A0A0G9GZV7_9GAMM|nr:biopolymer transporter ExbD [Dyella japonica]KLD62484.1 biopolymer transporter ExbD [Dyella japonica DSM 16301]